MESRTTWVVAHITRKQGLDARPIITAALSAQKGATTRRVSSCYLVCQDAVGREAQIVTQQIQLKAIGATHNGDFKPPRENTFKNADNDWSDFKILLDCEQPVERDDGAAV